MRARTTIPALCVAFLLLVSAVAGPAAAVGDNPGAGNESPPGNNPGAGNESPPGDNPGAQNSNGSLLVLNPRASVGGVTTAVLVEANSVRHAVVAADDPENNSTVASSIYVEPSRGTVNGDLVITCLGGVAQFGCDKHGNLTVGDAAVRYDGTNRVNLPALRGGGGDNVTVEAGNRSVTVVDLALDSGPSRIVDVHVIVLDDHGEGLPTAPTPAPTATESDATSEVSR
jgi:hypothetical protein